MVSETSLFTPRAKKKTQKGSSDQDFFNFKKAINVCFNDQSIFTQTLTALKTRNFLMS